MTAKEFLEFIREETRKQSETYKMSRGKAFMLWYAVEGLDLDQDDALDAASYDGGNDKAIDLFYVDDYYERIIIGQGKYKSSGTYKPTVGEFLELVHSVDWLSNPQALEREGRLDLAEAARDFCDAVSKGYSVEFVYVYLGQAHKELQDAIANFNSRSRAAQPVQSARALHKDLLRAVHDDFEDRSTRVRKGEILLENSKGYEEKAGFGRALVASIPATELKRLYEEHGDALFDRNVRLFLGTRKGGVNAQIQQTLEGPRERQNFWAYNNGLTFICSRYERSKEGNDLLLENFSIVNGCQTTVVVAGANDKHLKGVSVLARFVASEDENVIDSVILYTNSQTPIKPWEIASRSNPQKRLKADLAKEPVPYLYETRKGEKRALGAKERSKFKENGKLRVIPYDKLAQYLGTFNGLPTIAYKDKAKLFSAYREVVFPADISAEKAILVWRAGELAEEMVRTEIADAISSGDELQAKILRRGGKLFVLYVASLVLAERNGASFVQRIKREVVVSKKTTDRLRAYLKIAVVWYVESMREILGRGQSHGLNQVLRAQETSQLIKQSVIAKWKVQSMSRSWLDDALPKL